MVIASIIKKLFTFSLNQYLIRNVELSLIGTAEIQLELFIATLLLLSRESIRIAVTRIDITHQTSFNQIVNISYIPVLLISIT